jgi:hypothetical protein
MKSFFDYVAQEDSTLIYNDKEYQQSKFLLQNRMTSNLAQDLWGANESFQIYNATNEVLQKAISVLKSNTYTTFNLEK